jgi:type II secretory pathway component PulJ
MIARLRTRLSRVSDDGASEAGLSLVELLVAMMLTSIVLALVGSMFVNVALATSASNATTQRSSAAANTMNELVKVVRQGANNAVSGQTVDPAVVSATSTALTIYSFVDTSPTAPAPTKVAFRMDGTNLVEDRWTATKSSGYWVFTGSPATRVIGNAVVTTGADPLFAYLGADGKPIGSPAIAALTLDQRKLVTSVQIAVTIANQSRAGSSPIIKNTVGMPNLTASGTAK